MRSRSALFVLLFSATAAFTAPAPKERAADPTKLEGEWIVETWIERGRAMAAEATWTFKGNTFAFDQGRGVVQSGTIRMDVRKQPATIDLVIESGFSEGKEQLGIFKIEDDTLTMCLAFSGVAKRPTEWKSTKETPVTLITLKRKKK